jgi:hypothetical protein
MRDDFFSSKLVGKGRKDYKCDQCRGAIAAGSSHVCTSQSAAGVISGQRLHLECAKLVGVMPAAAPAEGVAS